MAYTLRQIVREPNPRGTRLIGEVGTWMLWQAHMDCWATPLRDFVTRVADLSISSTAAGEFFRARDDRDSVVERKSGERRDNSPVGDRRTVHIDTEPNRDCDLDGARSDPRRIRRSLPTA